MSNVGMTCLGNARLVFSSLKAPVSLRSLSSSFASSIATTRHLLPRRVFSSSIRANSHNDLFDYTSGRWVYNEALRLAERRLVFDVEGLRQLAAQSVGRSPTDIVSLSKLAEGGFNRTFLVTFRDDFQMVARIPYPATVPKYYAVASEAATMEFFRSSGLPVPQVYGYSPVTDNAAKTEYIFMQFMRGKKLSDVWPELGDSDIISILRQLVQLESRMMSISFPAGGSLYYARDLEKVAGRAAIPLEDDRFCVGPDTRLPMWYGRRSQLDVGRGPYKSAEAALVAAARKEIAYLQQFGQSLLPFHRERRYVYQRQEQSPSAHIENLNRYLLFAPSLVPKDPALGHFCVRHPDLQPNNIIVRKSSDSGWQVISLLDWQHASILPLFLLAGIPQRFQNHDDLVSHYMMLPSLPENFEELDEPERTEAEGVYRRRLVHYHYLKNTETYNKSHYDASTDHMCVLRNRLFHHASTPWEAETLELKVALIEATEGWETLTGGDTPCPIAFDAEDVRKTMELKEEWEEADKGFEIWQSVLGVGSDGWVSSKDYEEAVACDKQMKEKVLMGTTEEERVEIIADWPWDDMDEGPYM